MDMGAVDLEYVRGNIDVASVTVFALVRYMTAHGIPMDARITAGIYHDRPFLQLVWEAS
jgi:hypothetical protein